jgi:hypothetical protein
MNVEQLVEWELEGEIEVHSENLPLFQPQIPHDLTCFEPGHHSGLPAFNHLSCNVANMFHTHDESGFGFDLVFRWLIVVMPADSLLYPFNFYVTVDSWDKT